MRKNSMYFDTHRTRICRDIYRPSPNLVLFFKSVLSVLMVGQSPISKSGKARRGQHLH